MKQMTVVTLAISAMAIATVRGESSELPDTAWQDGSIVFGSADAGKEYLLSTPQTAKGIVFESKATLSGETLTLEAPATIKGAGAVLTPLAGTAGVQLLAANYATDVFLGAESKLLWRNAVLSADMRIRADICGGVIDSGRSYRPAEMLYLTVSGKTATAQFHCYDDYSSGDGTPKYVKAFKLQFDQVGDDVHARILWAKYASAANYGDNFDEVAAMGVYGNYATEKGSPGAIGITHLSVPGELTIDGRLPAGNVVAEATAITVLPSIPTTITNALSGYVDQVVFKSTLSEQMEWTHPEFVQSDEEVLVAQNTSIEGIGFVSAQMSGGYVNFKDSVDSSLYGSCSRISGNRLELQIQYYDRDRTGSSGITKMVFLVFEQRQADVYLTGASARYVQGNHLNEDNSSYTGASSVATGAGDAGYGVHNVVLSYRRGGWPIALTGSCRNSLEAGTKYIVDGADLTVSGELMLSRGYDLVVTNEAKVAFDLEGGKSVTHGYGVSNSVTVCTGCVFTVKKDWNVGAFTTIAANGGTIVLPTKGGTEGDCMVYLQRLTLRDGARVTGIAPYRSGYYGGDLTYYVHSTGAGPNYITSGIMGAYNNVDNPALDYYNFRTDADLVVSGPLIDAVQWKGLNWRKSGVADLVLSARGTAEGWFRVDEGTLVLGCNDVFSKTNALVLAGGAIDGSGYTNRLGRLTVIAPSSVVVGEGVLSFSDSSEAVWTPGATLSLTGDFTRLKTGHLRFLRGEAGSSTAGLRAEQISAIRYNGDQRVEVDNDGWVKSCSQGMIVIFR